MGKPSWFQRIISRDGLAVVCLRLLLGLVLLLTGIIHLQNVPGHAVTILNYRIVQMPTAEVLAITLPSLHVFLGTLFLLREFVILSCAGAATLFAIYFCAQLFVVATGLEISCGCFGAITSGPVSTTTLLRTFMLLLICVPVAMSEGAFSKWSVAGWVSKLARWPKPTVTARQGLSLIELLVCLAIVGAVVSLLLPAVQAARESGREVSCQNNVRQLALAAHNHESSYRYLPSTGWGYSWVGMRDRGAGKQQPGSWLFAVMPYCEQASIWSGAPAVDQPLNQIAFQRHVLSAPPILTCPSRSMRAALPAIRTVIYRYATDVQQVARNDYAVNAGDTPLPNAAGPNSVTDTGYQWPTLISANGVAYARSQLRLAEVSDGTSNVFFCGEKWANSRVNSDRGFDQPWSTGDSQETRRFTHEVFVRDNSSSGDIDIFGSSHATGCNFALVDGSVRMLHYSIHPAIFKTLGNRLDGNLGIDELQ